jgi:uncharacterized membrane protein YgcG
MQSVRYLGTALLCIAVAFGAAFMVRRATSHSPAVRATNAAVTLSPKRPATTPHHKAVAHHAKPAPRRTTTEKALAAQFTPGLGKVKRLHPKPKPKHKVKAPAAPPSTSVAPVATTPVETTPVAPVETTPAAPVQTPSAPTHTTSSPPASTGSTGGSSSGSSGSGVTSIGGGSGGGRGSGTTTIGG